ncbi:MAG: hypothetical protein GC201_13875 [Alphaproteobacteria bacterium]|nr:hypothetical protein [Alphaproteobacteria bacterium]
MRGRFVTMLAAGLLVAACASDTLYMPASGPGEVGYTESRTDPARFVVTYRGPSDMKPSDVYQYALLRAAEVTRHSGYGWFYIVDTQGRALPATGGDVVPSGPYGDYHRYYDESRHVVSLDIVMGYGHKPPKDPNAFDARRLQKDLDYLK